MFVSCNEAILYEGVPSLIYDPVNPSAHTWITEGGVVVPTWSYKLNGCTTKEIDRFFMNSAGLVFCQMMVGSGRREGLMVITNFICVPFESQFTWVSFKFDYFFDWIVLKERWD